MKRKWLRPVALVSVVAFLIANTPATALAVRCPWVLSAPTPTCACSEVASANVACCECCRKSKEAATQLDQPGRNDTSCPSCPKVPGCPYGCCWCSVAKIPCGTPPTLLITSAILCLGDLAEAALLLPPCPYAELMQPPRA